MDWQQAMRRCADAQQVLFDADKSVSGRTVYEGVGEGGDNTLALDRRCEDIVFAELERLAANSATGFTAISEERGHVVFGDPESPWRVVIDPIDGSLNTRRTIPWHSLSVAVASGPTMADVEWGYVFEFGAGEEFVARRGQGAWLDGRPMNVTTGPDFGLEIVGLESADPARIAPVIASLAGRAYRVRVIGSIAITMCFVAAGRLDAMLSARGCRSVDAAAAQLIVREAGGVAGFQGQELADASLDLDARYAVLAARDDAMFATAADAQAKAPTI